MRIWRTDARAVTWDNLKSLLLLASINNTITTTGTVSAFQQVNPCSPRRTLQKRFHPQKQGHSSHAMHKVVQVCVSSRMMRNSQLSSIEVMWDITAVIMRNVNKILLAIAAYISRGTGTKRAHCTNTHMKCKCLPWLKPFTHFLGCAVAATAWRMWHEL